MKCFNIFYAIAIGIFLIFGQMRAMDFSKSSVGLPSEKKEVTLTMPADMRNLIKLADSFLYSANPIVGRFDEMSKVVNSVKTIVPNSDLYNAINYSKPDLVKNLINLNEFQITNEHIDLCKDLKKNILTYHYSQHPNEICIAAEYEIYHTPDDKNQAVPLTKIDTIKTLLVDIRKNTQKGTSATPLNKNTLSEFEQQYKNKTPIIYSQLQEMVAQICANPVESVAIELKDIQNNIKLSTQEKKVSLQNLYQQLINIKPKNASNAVLEPWLKVDNDLKKIYQELKKTTLKESITSHNEQPALSTPDEWMESKIYSSSDDDSQAEDWTQLAKSQVSENDTQAQLNDPLNRDILINDSPEKALKNAVEKFTKNLPRLLKTPNNIDLKFELLDDLQAIEFLIFDIIQAHAQLTGKVPDDSDRLWRTGLIANKIQNDTFTQDQINYVINKIKAIEKTTINQIQSQGDPFFSSKIELEQKLDPLLQPMMPQPIIEQEKKIEKSQFNSKLLKEYRGLLLEQSSIESSESITQKLEQTNKRLKTIKVLAPRKKTSAEKDLLAIVGKSKPENIAPLSIEAAKTMHIALTELAQKTSDSKIKAKIAPYLTALASAISNDFQNREIEVPAIDISKPQKQEEVLAEKPQNIVNQPQEQAASPELPVEKPAVEIPIVSELEARIKRQMQYSDRLNEINTLISSRKYELKKQILQEGPLFLCESIFFEDPLSPTSIAAIESLSESLPKNQWNEVAVLKELSGELRQKLINQESLSEQEIIFIKKEIAQVCVVAKKFFEPKATKTNYELLKESATKFYNTVASQINGAIKWFASWFR